MYIPKKLKWNSLSEFKQFLQNETSEKIALFNGYSLLTETTEYVIIDGVLKYSEVKNANKSTTGRSDGTATNKERMGTHGRGNYVKSDRKKASKICAAKVPEKVSKSKKAPK